MEVDHIIYIPKFFPLDVTSSDRMRGPADQSTLSAPHAREDGIHGWRFGCFRVCLGLVSEELVLLCFLSSTTLQFGRVLKC